MKVKPAAEMCDSESQPVSKSSPELTPPTGSDRTKKSNVDQDVKELQTHAASMNAEPSRLEDSDKGPKEIKDRSHFEPPVHAWSGHHILVHSLRSDTFLRQALTSPYNQRTERHGVSGASPLDSSPRDTASACSSSPRMEGGGHAWGSTHLEKGRGRHHEGESGVRTASVEESPVSWDHLPTFKTPKTAKSMVFASPDKMHRDRIASGSSSPLSSVSGSSSSGHRRPHHNPFEQGHDRLHFPVFSPNMFNTAETPGRSEKETFQWNLEHIAELRPVHIDEKEIKRQMSKHSPDEEAEQRAQRAIDYYFQHHMVAPSPWSENPPPHVLPVTPAYSQGYNGLMMATPSETQGSIQKELTRSRKAVDISCQTVLTLPMDLDLDNVLGDYMTYQEGEESSGRDSISSSSLRRKLFFHADSSSILSPVRMEQRSPDHVAAALCTPPHPMKSTPEWERESPIHTPSSVQFSSSPIRGPLNLEGDYFRSSFSDHGALASPELSPIAEKHRVRGRGLRGFSSMSGDTELGEDGAEPGFGSHVKQHLQMEVHGGNSPLERLSPDVSPIACFRSGSGPRSRSRMTRANTSKALFSSPQHYSTHTDPHPHPHSHFSPLALPFSIYTQGSTSPHHSPSAPMDTDADLLPPVDKDGVALSGRDASMTEVGPGEGEGVSSDLDPLQQPSSMSTLDTGYQTGSGNGSLQTTHDCGVATTNTSTSALSSNADTSAQLKKLAAKLRSGLNEHGFVLRPTAGEAKAGGIPTDESSVDGMGSSVDGGGVLHSNLTNQFMSLPFRSELSADSADLETSLQFLQGATGDSLTFGELPKAVEHRNSSERGSDLGNFSVGSRGFSTTEATAANADSQNPESDPMLVLKGTEVPKPGAFHQIEEDFIDKDASFSAHDRYFYDKDADFLEKMGEYLEKGGDESDHSAENRAETDITPASNPTPATGENFAVKGADDSVLVRAREYLASVNYPQADGRALMEDVKQLGEQATNSAIDVPPPKLAGSSSSAKRLLGRVVEDLTADTARHGSPALASEVAKEILRRAELDLKRIDRAAHKTNMP